jgi:hypothetical protein
MAPFSVVSSGKTLDIPYNIFDTTSSSQQHTIRQIKTVAGNGTSLSFFVFCNHIAGC